MSKKGKRGFEQTLKSCTRAVYPCSLQLTSVGALTIASDDGERKVEKLLWIILLNADKTKYHGILTLRKFLSR